MSNSALHGTRIIDCTMWFAGPFATELLAQMGAEVIKVESIQAMDGWRGSITSAGSDRPWETAAAFNSVNHSKYDITLDLNQPEGVEVFKRLVKIGDIVVENYTPRVMKNFGLDYTCLKEINPALIMLSMPGYGTTGPWKDYVAFAFLVEETAGIPQITGYPDGPPMLMGASQADSIAGLNGAFAILTALEYRRKTGKGQYIDLSQVEALTCLMAEPIIDYSMNHRIWPRIGNRHRSMVPHGCYRCRGDDEWVVIAIPSDEEWIKFCTITGHSGWLEDERFSDASGRWKNQYELDMLIEAWTIKRNRFEVMHDLQAAGIASGAVLSQAEVLADPYLKERGFFEELDRAEVGNHRYPGVYAKFSKTPGNLRWPSPCLGEHNDYVFRELLGMSKEELAQLTNKRIVGNVPLAQSGRVEIPKTVR